MSGSDVADDDGKAAGAMLAIGELAVRIGVPTHVLRYWETRFPQLKPLQRSRSEEHTSELQSLMRISYADFCLKKKKKEFTKQERYNTIKQKSKIMVIQSTKDI